MRFGAISNAGAELLQIISRVRCNVIISGGTGSGKTTLLNCLTRYIDTHERIITCEDSAELQLQQPHVVRLETRPPNLEGEGEVTMRDLVKNCLRMRPERIIVGEVRGPEVFDLLQAMNTGHDGSMGTIHANSPRECLNRMEAMIAMGGYVLPQKTVREIIVGSVDIIIQAARLRDGTRRITHITEVVGLEGDVITTQDLVLYDIKGKMLLAAFSEATARPASGVPPSGNGHATIMKTAALHPCSTAWKGQTHDGIRRQHYNVHHACRDCLCGFVLCTFYEKLGKKDHAARRFETVRNSGSERAITRSERDRNADILKRRKQLQDNIKDLEARQKQREKNQKYPPLRILLAQAGLNLTLRKFYIYSGVAAFLATFIALIFGAPLLFLPGIAIAGFFGLPRWFVLQKRKRRLKKFLEEFPNALDVIVRATRAGLPLNDGLRLIASEAVEPVKSEFKKVVEAQQIGLSIPEAVGKMPDSMPCAETNFFAIVIQIQAQAGGNLGSAQQSFKSSARPEEDESQGQRSFHGS